MIQKQAILILRAVANYIVPKKEEWAYRKEMKQLHKLSKSSHVQE